MPDLTPPFPFRPPAARTVKEKSPIFYQRYLHQLYCGALLESQRRRVLHGENVLKPGQWLPPPSSAQNHLCAALFMTLWLQRAHGGSTSWKDQHWPQFEQEQLWLLTSELWHTDRVSEYPKHSHLICRAGQHRHSRQALVAKPSQCDNT